MRISSTIALVRMAIFGVISVHLISTLTYTKVIDSREPIEVEVLNWHRPTIDL